MKSKVGAIVLMGVSVLFALWGLSIILGTPERILSGGSADAYNYLIAVGKGTGLICVGIIAAVLASALNPKN